MPRKRADLGFTLLEVMMATVLLAVGSVSIIAVLTSAAAYATRRSEIQRQTQVLEEARSFARAQINRFQPKDGKKVPGDDDGRVEPQPSTLYATYAFELQFAPVNPAAPEMGYDTTLRVLLGDEVVRTEGMVIAADTIPDSEFTTSRTFLEERAGTDDQGTGEKK
jgi:prepilin-type N-terminal cleavage/methylation domain-containing protein